MKKLLLNMLPILMLISCAEKKESDNISENIETLTIEGAWEVTDIERKTADTSIVRKPWYKSIYIYTDNYYSIAAATEERPSIPVLKEDEKIDSEYFQNVYLKYISNSGTYKIVGDSLIHNIVVAKSPTVMNKNTRISQHIKLKKDEMIFTSANANGIITLITLKRLMD